jgi:hypothetical protein
VTRNKTSTGYKAEDDRLPPAQKQKSAKVNCKFLSQYHCVAFDIDVDIFVNCSWVATRWQLYNTHLHTNKYTEQHNEIEYTEQNIHNIKNT